MRGYQSRNNDRGAAVQSRRDLVVRMQQAKELIDQEEEYTSDEGGPVSGGYSEMEDNSNSYTTTKDLVVKSGIVTTIVTTEEKLDKLCDYDSKAGERQTKAFKQGTLNTTYQKREEDLSHKLKRQEKKALRKRAKAEKKIKKDPEDKKAKAEFNKQNDVIKKIMGITETEENDAKASGLTIFNIKENYTDTPPVKKPEAFDPKKTAEELITELTDHPLERPLYAEEIKMLLNYGVYDGMSESSKLSLAHFLKLYVSYDVTMQHKVFVNAPDPFDPRVLIKLFTPGTLEVDSKMKKENSYENRWVANHKDKEDLSKHEEKKLKRLEGKGYKGDVINPNDYKETLEFENKFIDVLGNLQKEAEAQKGQDFKSPAQPTNMNTVAVTQEQITAQGTANMAANSGSYQIALSYTAGINGSGNEAKHLLFLKYSGDPKDLARFENSLPTNSTLKQKIDQPVSGYSNITDADFEGVDMFPWLPSDQKKDGWIKTDVQQTAFNQITNPYRNALLADLKTTYPHQFGLQTGISTGLQNKGFSFVEKNKWPLLTAGAVTGGTGLFFIGKDIIVPDLKSGNWEKDLASITRFIPKQTFKLGFGQTYSQGFTNFAPWKGSFAFDPSKTDPAPSGELKSFTGTDFIKKVDPLDLRAKHISPLALDATFQLGQESKRLGDPWLNNNFEAYAKARYYYETNSTDINLFQMAEWAKLHFDAPKALDMIKTGTTSDITKNFATNPAQKLDVQTGGMYTFKTGAIKFTTGVDYLSMNNLDPSEKLYRAFLFKTAYEQTIKLDLSKKMPPADLKVSGNVSSGVSDLDNNFMAKKDITQFGANLSLDFKKQNGTTKQTTSIGLGYSGATVTDPNKSQGQTTTTDALKASLKFNAANTKWFQLDVGLDLTKSLKNSSSSGNLFFIIRPK